MQKKKEKKNFLLPTQFVRTLYFYILQIIFNTW